MVMGEQIDLLWHIKPFKMILFLHLLQITNEQQKAYLELLEQCQMQNDITAFTLFLQECQAQSLTLISSK